MDHQGSATAGRPPSGRGPARAAARSLGVIGLLASASTAAASFLPAPPDVDVAGVRWVCAATAGASLLMFAPWWRRLPLRATLVMLPVALGLITAHDVQASIDPFRYGAFCLLLFVWLGAHHPPGVPLAAAPLALASYAVPLLVAGDPTAVWTTVYAVPMHVVVGEVIARRSAALLRAQHRLHALAHEDVLTGLPNRRAFLAAVEAAAAGRPAVAFLDLDGFKAVNDAHGHARGDALLQATAGALRGAVRPGDVVARLAGDEFTVLLHGPVDPAEADRVVRRLRAAVAGAARAAVPGSGVQVSAGVAWCEGTGADAAVAVLARADEAMYRDKHRAGHRAGRTRTPAVLPGG